MLYAIGYLFVRGVGIWGVNIPIGWGFAIVNFVWWIGIGHAGTLISAILLLLRQSWRNSINRFAEAMTLFAVACAGMFPLLHIGRPWLAYWLFPYPNTMRVLAAISQPAGLGRVCRLHLLNDLVAFWFIGLIPDLATLRDRSTVAALKIMYGILAMGWRGSARHWHRYETAYLLLAGLATPLVLSVHTVVSFDFSVAILPGWHSTIFPALFCRRRYLFRLCHGADAGDSHSKFYGLEDFITLRHLENMAKILLATGLIVGYGYTMEAFMGWYSGNLLEEFVQTNRMIGPYAWAYWILISCNVSCRNCFGRPEFDQSMDLVVISGVFNVGMWQERYVIVVTSLHRDFLPSSWGIYQGSVWDWATFWAHSAFSFCVVSVSPVSAHDFDLRNADAGTRGRSERGTHVRPPIYGLLAEFASPNRLGGGRTPGS